VEATKISAQGKTASSSNNPSLDFNISSLHLCHNLTNCLFFNLFYFVSRAENRCIFIIINFFKQKSQICVQTSEGCVLLLLLSLLLL